MYCDLEGNFDSLTIQVDIDIKQGTAIYFGASNKLLDFHS